MKSYIVLIRHGITQGILNKWFYGWADLPLVKEGYEQLLKFKEEGAYPEVPDDAKFYTTGFVRTTETLVTLFGAVPYTEIPEMKEINFGDWECNTFKQLAEKEGGQEWLDNADGTFKFPGGECMNDYYARIKRGNEILIGYHRMQELAHRHSGKDAVSVMICHGGSISGTMMNWFPNDREVFWDWTPLTGLGYTVYFENGEPVSYDVLTCESAKDDSWRKSQI
ncbi:MAG: histidine phosphatase family protein [Firmicutes bacterium]|nr:histidine phosphatase family protein [Bacillota bacterium]